MARPQRSIRVALARLWPGALFGLEESIKKDPALTCLVITEPPHDLWKRVMVLAADVLILLAPDINDEIRMCVDSVTRTTSTSICLISRNAANSRLPRSERLCCFTLPESGKQEQAIQELLHEIHHLGLRNQKQAIPLPNETRQQISATTGPIKPHVLNNTLVALGSSTGGTEALLAVFRALPANMPGMVVVQHMPPVFTEMYANRLNNELPFQVVEACDNTCIQPGSIHIAPGGYHLQVVRRGGGYYTRISEGPKQPAGHCPSVDVLFDSVAAQARQNAVGIILTGMGSDGAKGMLKMREAGAYTLGQDEGSSVVYGMPRKAYEIGAVVKQCKLSDIAGQLVAHLAALP